MDKWKRETPMMARNRSLHERLMTFSPPHHYPAYVATKLERDENGPYLKIPLISPLAAAYKHQACKYCSSFEVGPTHSTCCSRRIKRLPFAQVLDSTPHFPHSVHPRRCAKKRGISGSLKTRSDSTKNFHVLIPHRSLSQSLYAYQEPPTRLPSPLPS